MMSLKNSCFLKKVFSKLPTLSHKKNLWKISFLVKLEPVSLLKQAVIHLARTQIIPRN